MDSLSQEEHLNKEVIAIYERHQCPAELIVSYRIASQRGLLDSYLQSRFCLSIWNMDSPWIMAIVLPMLLNLTVFAAFAIGPVFHFVTSFKFLGIILAGDLIFLAPIVYAALVVTNLRLGYGKYWWHSLSFPTHIGITDSGFKLYFRGRLFYNYPNLSLWSAVYDLDLVTDPLYTAPAIRFIYHSGFGRKEIMLPLHGLASESDVRLVLQYLAKYVPPEYQAPGFIALREADFAPVIDEYKSAQQLLCLKFSNG